MKIHHPFDTEPEFDHRVPPWFPAKLEPILPRIIKVEVERVDKHNHGEDVNALELDVPEKPEDPPEVDSRELAQIILEMAAVDAEKHEFQDLQPYRARIIYWDKKKQQARKTFLHWKWDPYEFQESARPGGQSAPAPSRDSYRGARSSEEPDVPMVHDEGSWRAEYQFTRMAAMEEQIMRMFAMMMGQVDTLLKTVLTSVGQMGEEHRKALSESRTSLKESRLQTDKAQDRLFRMALHVTQANEQQDMINQRALDMFQQGWSMFWYGTQQSQREQQRRHAEEVDRLRREKVDENRWSFIAQMGPPAVAFAAAVMQNINPQFAAFLNQFAAQGMGEEEEDGANEHAAPNGFEAGPSAPPGGFSQGPSSASGPRSNEDRQAHAQARKEASDRSEAQFRAEIDQLSMAERARRFAEGFSPEAQATFRARAGDEIADMIAAFARLKTDKEVCSALFHLTQAMRANPTADDALNESVTRNQMAYIDSIATQMQKMAQQGPIDIDPAPPGAQPSSSEPDEPPADPPSTTPVSGPQAPPSFDLAPPGFGPTSAPDEPRKRRESDPLAEERRKAKLDRMLDDLPKVPNETHRELMDGWGSIEALREAEDDELLALRGIGPAWLSKLRDRLDER